MPILGQEPITRVQVAAGSRGSTGYFTPGASTTSTILAGVQPLTGSETEALPQGMRKREWLKVYTEETLRTVEQYTPELADRLVIDGITYVVWTTRPQRSIIPHYKALIVRLQEGAT